MDIDSIKIAICADEKNEDGALSDRLSRCNYFAIYNHSSLTFTFHESLSKGETSGAGAVAAKQISDLEAGVILVPEVGPKAFKALDAFGIEIYKYSNKNKTVRDALYEYYENKLPKLLDSTKSDKHS